MEWLTTCHTGQSWFVQWAPRGGCGEGGEVSGSWGSGQCSGFPAKRNLPAGSPNLTETLCYLDHVVLKTLLKTLAPDVEL